MANTSLKGRERFRRLLLALPKVARAKIKPALMEGANLIVQTQKDLCPVLSIATIERRPGALRESIKATPGGHRRGKHTTQDPELTVTISAGDPPDVAYAAHVEWGTQDRPPEPYFYPGLRAGRKDAQSLVKKAVRDAIRSTIASTPA
jgi:HK97 gp10 family phage protein